MLYLCKNAAKSNDILQGRGSYCQSGWVLRWQNVFMMKSQLLKNRGWIVFITLNVLSCIIDR